ncbi:MAG TPA: lytic transglycosylase domain-containing protein [Bryobacteraceae bacterium]|nr:lytic transglycosylase domain-containing protein [Bryobacteraceae bacterium]
MRFCFSAWGCLILVAAASAAELADSPARTASVVKVDRRTGRLVRALVASPPGAVRGVPATQVPEFVRKAAELHDLDPLLVHSVIGAESAYNPFALSPKGARGLMQLMPATARRFGVANSFNMTDNVSGGVRYLRYLMDMFGDTKLAVAAYNAGEEAVIRYGGVPPYRETQNYVRTVSAAYDGARKASVARTPTAAEPAETSEPVWRPIEQYLDQEGNLHIRTR